MAANLDMDADLYTKKTLGKRNIAIDDLYHIHNRLGVDLNGLFENVDPEESEFRTLHSDLYYSIDEAIEVLCSLVAKLPWSKQVDAYMNMVEVFAAEARNAWENK